MGNAAYPFLFVGMGIVAGMAHVLFSGHPAIGASGAISGVMAMCLVWYPTNRVELLLLRLASLLHPVGWFEVSSYWIMLLGLAFDFSALRWGWAAWRTGRTRGIRGEISPGVALMQRRWVSMDDTERTLLDMFGLRTAWRDRVARSALEAATAGSAAVRYPAPPGNPMPIPQEDTIPVVCACGKLLKAKREFAGRRGRCPACLAPIRIPQE